MRDWKKLPHDGHIYMLIENPLLIADIEANIRLIKRNANKRVVALRQAIRILGFQRLIAYRSSQNTRYIGKELRVGIELTPKKLVEMQEKVASGRVRDDLKRRKKYLKEISDWLKKKVEKVKAKVDVANAQVKGSAKAWSVSAHRSWQWRVTDSYYAPHKHDGGKWYLEVDLNILSRCPLHDEWKKYPIPSPSKPMDEVFKGRDVIKSADSGGLLLCHPHLTRQQFGHKSLWFAVQPIAEDRPQPAKINAPACFRRLTTSEYWKLREDFMLNKGKMRG